MPRSLRALASTFALATGVVVSIMETTAASSYDPALYSAMRWRSIGPYRGGRVTAVAGVPSQPFLYYMGATGGGVWKTEDAGLTWTVVSDGFFKTGSVGAIAVADSAPATVYVGMGEACLRGNLSHGDGVYKSTDAGRTWTHVGLDDSRQIGRIRIHPQNPDIVYVAAVGHPYGPNAERGIFRTKDGGKSWQIVLYVDDRTGAVDLAMDPGNPQVLYAATWQVLRTPWDIESGGPGSGIYKTTDGGDHWMRLTEGLPAQDKGKIGVAISPVDTSRLWAVVPAGRGHEEGGIFRSDDGGKSWRLVSNPPEAYLRDYYYGHIYADTQNVDTIYVFRKEFLKSVDGGRTWQELRAPHGDFHDLWIDPKNNQRMINGSDGGAAVTFNGGRSWSPIDNQPTAQFYAVISDNQMPYRIYGSQQDNTTVSIASRTSGGVIDETEWYPVGGGESGYIAPDPTDANIVYGGSYFGHLTRYDHRTKEVRNITVWPDYPGGRVAADMKYRFQWTFPIIASRHEPKTVYAGANGVFKSTNEGQSWEPISPDLTRNDKTKQRGGRLEEYYCTLFTLAESPRERGVFWAGSDDGLVHVTRNGGKAWQNVTPPGLQAWSRINIIEASPHDAAAAYLAATRYQLDDFRPYIYRTADFGKTWQLVTNGIPRNTFVRVVREDPKRKGLLYAGTETGLYLSFDEGQNWQTLQLNLPIVPITDLTVKENDLIAATQGRSFWVLDDLTPLHQLTDAVSTSRMHLFQPRPAVRAGRGGGFRRSAAAGQNPPAGVVIYYFLQEKPARGVTLEFLDSHGQVIKSFSGGEGPAAERRGPGIGRPGVSAEAGMNRFEWDMRYPDAEGIEGGTFLAGGTLRGPVAVPGTYQVKLTADGRSATESFEIRKDPRYATSAADIQTQFDLLMAIRDRLTAAHQAVNRIRAAQKEVQASVERAKGSLQGGVAQAAGKLNARLTAILNELVEPRFTGLDDQMLVFPLKLNNRIAALQGYVSSADYPPTDQAHQVFKELSGELEDVLGRLQRILNDDLAAFKKMTDQ